jgi:hypothetical protein
LVRCWFHFVTKDRTQSAEVINRTKPAELVDQLNATISKDDTGFRYPANKQVGKVIKYGRIHGLIELVERKNFKVKHKVTKHLANARM